jgi:mannose-6-phosphate isomerase-like protein (cupin superfamily)
MELTSNCDRADRSTLPGPHMRLLLSPSNSAASAMSCAEATLVPGALFREHYHLLAEEMYYILQGTGEVFIQGETKRVKAGDVVLIPPGHRHRILNPASAAKNLVFLAVSTPPYSVDDEYITEI